MEDSKQKANLFAAIFDSKAQLPPEEVDTPYFGPPDEEYEGMIPDSNSNSLRGKAVQIFGRKQSKWT